MAESQAENVDALYWVSDLWTAVGITAAGHLPEQCRRVDARRCEWGFKDRTAARVAHKGFSDGTLTGPYRDMRSAHGHILDLRRRVLNLDRS